MYRSSDPSDSVALTLMTLATCGVWIVLVGEGGSGRGITFSGIHVKVFLNVVSTLLLSAALIRTEVIRYFPLSLFNG